MFIQIEDVRINTDHIIKYGAEQKTYTDWAGDGNTTALYSVCIMLSSDPHNYEKNNEIVFTFSTKEQGDKILQCLDITCGVNKIF